MLKIKFSNMPSPLSDNMPCVVYPIFSDLKLPAALAELDKNNGQVISRAIANGSFKGTDGNILTIPSLPSIDGILILLGLGAGGNGDKKPDVQNTDDKSCNLISRLEVVGARLFASLNGNKSTNQLKDVTVICNDLDIVKQSDSCNEISENLLASALASGAQINSFKFDKYLTTRKHEDISKLESLTFAVNDVESAQNYYKDFEAVAAGNHLTRLVVSEPPNVIYPETMAQAALELTALGVEVKILGEKELTEQGFGSLLAVGQGSARDSQLVIMQWHGSDNKDDKPVAVVGKGVTFDTGGINIKPSNGMEDMKYDMAGAGVVLGLMKALALRKAKVNVVGVMGLAENMPSGSAQRPSDIVKSLSGQTIEVLNTDAEGRMVLADALWYTQKEFDPCYIIDLATLTGAITVALGYEYAGSFSNNDELANKLTKAGSTVHEFLWRMPMCKSYNKDIDSTVADVKNIGAGRGAGSSTAAHFLERFVNKKPWAHLDIAGMAWEKGAQKPLTGKGATGFGVRLLNIFLKENFEK